MNESALPELPGGWVWTRLGEIAEKINPGFPSGKHNKESRGIPHLRPMNINAKGEIDFSVVKYVQPDSYDPLLKGDVLFNNTNSPELLGKTAYIKDDTNWAYSNHMTRIRLNSSFLNYAWISYYLHSLFLKGFFKMSCTHHVNQASINSTFISQKVPIPLPPLPEQRRIVTKLEELFTKLDAGVSALKKSQAQLKRYRQSVLKDAYEGKLVPTAAELAKAEGRSYEPADVLMAHIKDKRMRKAKDKFKELLLVDKLDLSELPEGWIWTKIGEIGEVVTGTTPSKSRTEFYSKDFPFFKPNDLNYGYYVKKADDGLSKEGLERARLLPAKSILVTCIGATIGKTGFTRVEGSSNQQINAIIPEKYVLPEYIYFICISPQFQKSIIDNASATTLPILNKSKFEILPIPLPPLAEQRRIVAEVERRLSVADEVARTVEQSLTQAERLRQSILKKAFEGRLVAQDASDEPAAVLLERIKAEKAWLGKNKQKTRITKDL